MDREVVLHLLRRCRECVERLRPLVAPGPPASESGYDEAITRVFARVRSRRPGSPGVSWSEVERGVARLRSRPLDEADAELRGRPLVEALIQLSFEERYRDPQAMLELALFARLGAEHLRPGEHDPMEIADCQARAWAELANAHRVGGDLAAAAHAMNAAEQHLARGTGNLLLAARIAELRASLLSEKRLFSDACGLLEHVHRIYESLGDRHLAGRALVKLGIYTDYYGEPQEGMRLLKQGLDSLDRERDPALVVSSTENLLELMVRCGEHRAARRLLLASGLRRALADQPLNLLKLRWVEGHVSAGLGRPAHAEAAFKEVRAGFLEHGLDYRAAIAGLDLAAVWLEQGKAARVEELAREMLATFRSLGIQREALRALDFLHRVCARSAATPGLVRHVGRFLLDLEREPQLRFQAV